jgi:hypothetical protein
MRSYPPLAGALGACALLAAAGGGGGGTKAAATATQPPAAASSAGRQPLPIPTSPQATFVWDGASLKPGRLRVPRVAQVTLVLISADGRPHRASVATPTGTRHLRVAAGAREEVVLRRLRPGATYHVVPSDGTDAAVLQVG